jgi:glycosyltransferase involved in cell wall biosynthesis
MRGDWTEDEEKDEVKFVVVSEPTFETWDWTNPDVQGIGGSETSHIEMAGRLSRHGHSVFSYAPVPFDDVRIGPGGEWWHHSKHFEPITGEGQDADVYAIYRAPQFIDLLPAGAKAWLICQDVDYTFPGRGITEERARKLTRIVALCKRHADYLKARYPFAKDKIVQSSNGIKTTLIEQISAAPPPRNPRRLIYASSPDRGMEYLLDIFPRAKEIVPDLELHLYYGFNNIDRVVERAQERDAKSISARFVTRNTERLRQIIDQPGVFDHGRMGQSDLLSEWFKAGIWCHPSNFTETSCITCMDAQACGAVPITSPVWAVEENVQHGVFVDGDVTQDLTRSRFVLELVKLALQPKLQEQIRREMMPWARSRFDWEGVVDQWEVWADQDDALWQRRAYVQTSRSAVRA